jgi:uncharacterized membrane protein YvbJ
MECPKCSTENREGSLACWKCCAPLNPHRNPAGQVAGAIAEAETKPARRSAVKLAVAAVIAIIVVPLGWLIYSTFDSPARVAVAYMKAASTGDMQAVMHFYPSNSLRKCRNCILGKTLLMPTCPRA